MKNRNLIVIVGSLLFVLANSYAITREFFYLPLLSAAAVVIYLMIWHVDWLMYLTALSVPFSIVPDAIELCDEIMAGTDDAFPGDFLGRPALYARKKDQFFRRFDGGIANIAYSRDRIRKEQVRK